jgi:YggT family protein
MFVLGNLLMTVAGILEMAVNLYTVIIIVAALVSWVNADPYNQLVRVLRALTEPLYFRIRQKLPFVRVGGLDLSPLIVLLLLQLFRGVALRSLYQFGQSL